MNIRRGLVSLGLTTGVLLGGSAKNTVKEAKYYAPKQAVKSLSLKPQLITDTFKIHTIEHMDDAPVLPSFRK